jgi:hypothetical protein
VEQNLQKENKKKEGFGEHWFPDKIKKKEGFGEPWFPDKIEMLLAFFSISNKIYKIALKNRF